MLYVYSGLLCPQSRRRKSKPFMKGQIVIILQASTRAEVYDDSVVINLLSKAVASIKRFDLCWGAAMFYRSFYQLHLL